MWEEPPISGESGSGTVFFSGCALHCVYCQNADISNGKIGREVSIERLAEIFLEQQGRGANNINLVTPTHFAPQIVEAIKIARTKGLELPIVCNTSGYEGAEALAVFDGYVDIYLVDLKYASAELAARYSKAADYPRVASAALDEMYRQVGPYWEDDQTGLAKRGVIVRHLLLPDCLDDSFAVMRVLARKPYINDIIVSLMSQYTPFYKSSEHKEINRRISTYEYEKVAQVAAELGFDGFMQERSSAKEEYTPDFDLSGI